MADLFDYLDWRGDIPLSQVPFGPVDNLILSTLSYVRFETVLPSEPGSSVPLKDAAEAYLSLPEGKRGLVRCKQDLELLRALCRAPRFSALGLTCCEDRFEPEREMQFAALAVLLGGKEAFLAFRGTDSTLVGWKEDFNMSFMEAVPAQQAALVYLERFAARFPGRLRLGGHSKGGNLAVYAAARCGAALRRRITAVYNNDGPGFPNKMVASPGYQALLPKLHTYLPQSSVVGMLLEHGEAYTVVKSRQIGLLQHDPYSWEVMGGGFVEVEDVTPGSRLADRTITTWLAGLNPAERETIIDGVFGLLSAGEASYTSDLMRPRTLQAALRSLKDTDEDTLRLLTQTIAQLTRTAVDTMRGEG